MRFLEIRRHSLRDRPSEHLSPEGIALAREVGRACGPFDRAYSSPHPRALETLREMGGPTPTVLEEWADLGDAVSREIDWPAPFSRYAVLLGRDSAVARKGRQLIEAVEGIVRELPEEGTGVLVTHGGFPEIVSVTLFPEEDHRGWGGPIRCLEGARIAFRAGRPDAVTVRRLPASATRL
ncbi:MAG TPA: histidine phosphatase family protein [Thermoplasmata archaeon]|nr:histidine phosphatase family protein [Thermoplasmata archaeon]